MFAATVRSFARLTLVLSDRNSTLSNFYGSGFVQSCVYYMNQHLNLHELVRFHFTPFISNLFLFILSTFCFTS